MNKAAIAAMSALTLFTGYCAYLAYHYERSGNNELGSWFRIRGPDPVSPAAIRQEQALIAAATMRTDLQINGRPIVVTNSRDMLNPERHDMAHAIYRAEHKLTQTK